MERIMNSGDVVIRYDDDINKVGLNLVVKAIRSRYPFVVGFRTKDISSTIFIELKIDCGMLGGKVDRMINYLDIMFDVEREVDQKIKEMVKVLYKTLPDEVVNFYYAKYEWGDNEYKHRSDLHMMGYYCK